MSDKIIIYKDLYYIEDIELYGVAMARDCKPRFSIYLEDDKDDLGITKVIVNFSIFDTGERYYSKFHIKDADILKEKITTRIAELLNKEIVDLRLVPLIIAECEAEIYGD